MTFKKGQIVKFRNLIYNDMIPDYRWEDDSIIEFPNIIHGNLTVDRQYYDKNFMKVVDIYARWFIVQYKDDAGKFVQLGFTEDKLEPVFPNWKERYSK